MSVSRAPTLTDPQRFWSKVQKTDGCWLWMGGRYPTSYGKVRVSNRTTYAHRVAWALSNGEIPAGLHVCHHCDNPPCVRPDHLFVGTCKDNMQDRARKGRSGHITHPEAFVGNPNAPRGEAHPRARLTNDAVVLIRQLWRTGDYTQTELGELFGCSHDAISRVVNLKSWTHIKAAS